MMTSTKTQLSNLLYAIPAFALVMLETLRAALLDATDSVVTKYQALGYTHNNHFTTLPVETVAKNRRTLATLQRKGLVTLNERMEVELTILGYDLFDYANRCKFNEATLGVELWTVLQLFKGQPVLDTTKLPLPVLVTCREGYISIKLDERQTMDNLRMLERRKLIAFDDVGYAYLTIRGFSALGNSR